jgi:hypothetical protein
MQVLQPICHVMLVAFFGLGIAGQARAGNLIKDGGFETPPTPMGTFTTYGPGQMIGPWTVIGQGNVATVNDFDEGGVLWAAHHGHAFVDLTGTCDCGADSGVSQTIKTVAGTTYTITFWVGNTVIQNQGATSTVLVYLGATKILSATNKKGQGSSKEVWKKFSTSFVATGSSSVLAFVNGDPDGDEQNGVDDVSVTAE